MCNTLIIIMLRSEDPVTSSQTTVCSAGVQAHINKHPAVIHEFMNLHTLVLSEDQWLKV